PWRCLGAYEETIDPKKGLPARFGSFPTKCWTVSVPFIGRLDLPSFVLWAGLVLNTIFYTLLAWGLWQVPLVIRRRRRRRLNRCVNCGYDRTSLAPGIVCPECASAPRVSPHTMAP